MTPASLMNALVAGQPTRVWLLAVALALAVTVGLSLARHLVLWRMAAHAQRTASLWDDVVVDAARRTSLPTRLVLGLFAGSQLLDLPVAWRGRIEVATWLVCSLQVGLWGTRVVHYAIVAWVDRRGDAEDQAQKTSRNMLRFLSNLLVWTGVVLVACNLLGLSASSLATGLGVFGLALTLATQNIVADIFASISVLLDKPFLLGDFIIVDDCLGWVERIGIKTTRLRSLGGENIILANSDLTKSRVRNFRGMPTRRIVFTFALRHGTSLAALREVPNWLRELVDHEPKARFDRAELRAFVEAGFQFELVYYVLDPDYRAYTALQQRINFGLLEHLEARHLALGAPARAQLEPALAAGASASQRH